MTAFSFTYRGTLVLLCLLPPALLATSTPDLGVRVAFLGVLLAGVGIRLAGVRIVGGRARVHSAGARELACDGPFRHVRHPLYVGNGLFAVGVLGMLTGALPAVLGGAVLLLVYGAVTRHEEASMVEQFGGESLRYRQEVPALVPRLRARRAESGSDRTRWVRVLRLERWFVAAGVVLGAVLLAIPETSFPGGPGLRALVVTSVTLGLMARTAARLHRRRGSWLAVERLSGADDLRGAGHEPCSLSDVPESSARIRSHEHATTAGA